MAENVIRKDVIEVSVKTDMGGLEKLGSEMDKLKKSVTGGEDNLDKLKKAVDGVGNSDGLKKTKETAEGVKDAFDKSEKSGKKLSDRLTDIGKKAGGVAYNGLKKLAGISFKALAAGITGAATAIGFMVKNSVSAYAEYEQLKGGMETLLGTKGAKNVEEYAKIAGKSVEAVKGEYDKLVESEKLVMKNANDAFKTAGLSANEYMSTVTTFAAHLKNGTGGDALEATKLADMAIQDMADNANKMGTPIENIQTVYTNLARGMYMTLDNLALPYAGTKEGAKQLVNDAAKVDKSIKSNDISFTNLVKAIHVIQDQMGITGTTSKEAFGTISGSLSMFKSAWGNLMPALIQGGDAFDQCVNNLVDSIVGFKDEATGEIKGGLINNLLPAIEKALVGVGTLIERLAPIISEHFPVLAEKIIPPLITAAVQVVNGLIKALPTIIKVLFQTIADICGEQLPILKSFFGFFANNSGTIAKFVPVLLGLIGAFMAFKKVKSAISIVSGLFGKGKGESDGMGGDKKGGFLSNIGKQFSELGKHKPAQIAKGVANLAIIVGGITALTAVIVLIATLGAKAGADFGATLQVVALIGAVGLVGAALAKTAELTGNIPIGTTLKALANMAIMIAGVGILVFAISKVFASGVNFSEMLQVVALIGILGTVGTVLTLFGAIAGLMPIPTVLMGLANMAIVLVGLGALLFAMTKVFATGVNFGEMAQIIVLIGLLGAVGTVLSAFAAIIGLIPIPIVLMGLVNIGLVLTGMGALLFLMTRVFANGLDFATMYQVITLIGVLGTVGSVLALFAGVIGMIPFPLVLLGLTNIGLVLGGITALIIAFGKLSEIPGFNEFLTKGGETLVKIFNILGEMVGALAGGVIEGLSSALPALGENLGKFGESIQPLFAAMSGVDIGGVGAFFTALVGLLGVATGNEIVEGIKSFFGGGDESPLVKLGNDLSAFAEAAKPFFDTVGTIQEQSFTNATKMFDVFGNAKMPKEKDGWLNGSMGTQLSEFATNAKGFFEFVANANVEALSSLFTKLNEMGTTVTSLKDTVTADFNALKDTIVSACDTIKQKFSETIDGIKTTVDNTDLSSGGQHIVDTMIEGINSRKEAAVAAIAAITNAINSKTNTVISGANWALKEFGSDKRLTAFSYARGTDGHRGGNAIVNDGRGAEMVQMPNGDTFIPRGKNVFIPNAPKGMKVLPAEQTARVMGKSSPTFYYAKGIGDVDVFSYLDNARGLAEKIGSTVVYDGLKMGGLNLAKAMVKTETVGMVGLLEKTIKEFGGGKLVALCRKFLGVPYVWGGTSPSGFDCSGLMQYVYAMCGKAIPRVAADQFAAGKPVETPRPGDLVFFKGALGTFSAPGHVGMYIGNGQMIHAPRTGDVVKIAGAFRGDYLGARRYENGGIATKASIFGENGAEMAIPLSNGKRRRGLSLWRQTGDILGAYEYSRRGETHVEENTTISPVFNLTITGENTDSRAMERRVKKWVREALAETFESMERRNANLQPAFE